MIHTARLAKDSVSDYRGELYGTVDLGSLVSFGALDVPKVLGEFHRDYSESDCGRVKLVRSRICRRSLTGHSTRPWCRRRIASQPVLRCRCCPRSRCCLSVGPTIISRSATMSASLSSPFRPRSTRIPGGVKHMTYIQKACPPVGFADIYDDCAEHRQSTHMDLSPYRRTSWR